MHIQIPELEPHCGSWVVTRPSDGRAFELFNRENVERAAGRGWQVETAAQYLGRINREFCADAQGRKPSTADVAAAV